MDGKKVVPPLVERIKDPDMIVRNNALRVLGDIAETHPEFVIPVKPLIAALNYPKSSDRSKSVYAVYMLASNSSAAREEILRDGVPNLLLLLETKVPDQKEFAHNTLKKVSGKEYPISDLNSWKNWYSKLKKDKGLPSTK
jgi:HEAT repeat protein